MAKGRMINNKITGDKRINDLSDDTNRLAFTWLVTFADIEGRTYGDPAMVRSLLFPRRDDVTIERMTKYLQEWHEQGLVIWYEADGDKWIQFSGFKKNQYLRPDREPASEIPEPTTGSLPDNCRSNDDTLTDEIPVKLKEIKRIESNTADAKVFTAYENEIGALTPFIRDTIDSHLSDGISPDWIVEACGIAAKNNVRKLAYVMAIVTDWKVNGKGKNINKKRVESIAAEVYQ